MTNLPDVIWCAFNDAIANFKTGQFRDTETANSTLYINENALANDPAKFIDRDALIDAIVQTAADFVNVEAIVKDLALVVTLQPHRKGNNMKRQIAREIQGALKSAQVAHPEIDYANCTSSIVKRILGTNTLSTLVSADEDLTRTMVCELKRINQ